MDGDRLKVFSWVARLASERKGESRNLEKAFYPISVIVTAFKANSAFILRKCIVKVNQRTLILVRIWKIRIRLCQEWVMRSRRLPNQLKSLSIYFPPLQLWWVFQLRSTREGREDRKWPSRWDVLCFAPLTMQVCLWCRDGFTAFYNQRLCWTLTPGIPCVVGKRPIGGLGWAAAYSWHNGSLTGFGSWNPQTVVGGGSGWTHSAFTKSECQNVKPWHLGTLAQSG